MKHRHFTRTDVATFVADTIGKAQTTNDKVSFEVQQVSLLTETTAPIWLVEWVLVDTSGLHHSRYRGAILVTQRFRKYALSSTGSREYFLSFLETIELPEGCKTIQEEEKAVKERAR